MTLPGAAQAGVTGQLLQWLNPMAAVDNFLINILVNLKTLAEFQNWLTMRVVFVVLVVGLLFLYAGPALRLEAGAGRRLWPRSGPQCCVTTKGDGDAGLKVVLTAVVSLVMISVSACGGAPAKVETQFENLNPKNFTNPTLINNEWFPMKPGTQYVFEGNTADTGKLLHHRLLFTVTDLTKVIGDVRTVVAWIVDYGDSQVVEKEIAFYAQDNEGTVWYLGEYPEAYENGQIVDVPTWTVAWPGRKRESK